MCSLAIYCPQFFIILWEYKITSTKLLIWFYTVHYFQKIKNLWGLFALAIYADNNSSLFLRNLQYSINAQRIFSFKGAKMHLFNQECSTFLINNSVICSFFVSSSPFNNHLYFQIFFYWTNWANVIMKQLQNKRKTLNPRFPKRQCQNSFVTRQEQQCLVLAFF